MPGGGTEPVYGHRRGDEDAFERFLVVKKSSDDGPCKRGCSGREVGLGEIAASEAWSSGRGLLTATRRRELSDGVRSREDPADPFVELTEPPIGGDRRIGLGNRIQDGPEFGSAPCGELGTRHEVDEVEHLDRMTLR